MPLELVLADGTRVPLVGEVTVGRSPAMTLCLDDPSVSRAHARIRAGDDGVVIEDTGSSYGTFVDERRVAGPVPLRDGAQVRIGDQSMSVAALRTDEQAGKTIVVPVGASLMLPGVGATDQTRRPRLRSGYALKRLDASEGDRRWVVRNLNDGTFLRLTDADGQLMALLDGSRTIAELLGEAEARLGPAGMPALVRVLGDLGERGMLAGVDSGGGMGEVAGVTGWRRWVRPREKAIGGLGRLFAVVYRAGGWVLFTRPAVVLWCLLSLAGIGVFVELVAERYGTPFLVADRLVLGGAVFLAGRAALVVMHELAHGLAMESVGRQVHRAGFKLLLIFPYAFVDTSEVWFEPRRRRMLVTAAGPLSDFTLAGLAAIICLVSPPGVLRDVCFQVASAGYIAALFNLNPFLERDGYHLLADRLGVPGLRAKARAQLRARLSGTATDGTEPVLMRYSLAGLGWTVMATGIVVVFAQRYRPVLEEFAPTAVVNAIFYTLGAATLVPVFIVLVPPLLARARGRTAEA